MATPSPRNWSERDKRRVLRRPGFFQSSEDFARHQAALEGGPTGGHPHSQNVYQSGPHKGKTKDQVEAEKLQEGYDAGLPRKSTIPPGLSRPAPSLPVRAAPVSTMPAGIPSLGKMPSITAPASLQPTIPSPLAPAPSPVPAATPQPMPRTLSAPELDAQVAAQGIADQRAGVTQRGTDGSVLYNNGASISPTSPTGGRVLTAPRGGGSVTMTPAKTKTFDGMAPSQFGATYAARNGESNRFAPKPPRLGQPAPAVAPSSAMGPAQKALADFNAANPNVKTQAEIDQLRADYKASDDKVAAIRAKYAAPPPPLNGMQIMTPDVARAAKAADASQNTPLAAAPSQTATLNGRPYKSPLASSMGLPQPGQRTPDAAPAPATSPSAPPQPQPLLADAAPGNQFRSFPSLRNTMGVQFRANGGPVTAGQPYVVGEQGPELVVPSQDATVIPNHQLRPPSLRAKMPPVGAPSTPPRPLAGMNGKPPARAHPPSPLRMPPVKSSSMLATY